MNNLFNVLQIALKVMKANKIRTALTVLGIVIGIASIIIVYSAGEGVKGLIYSQIETFGTDIIETEVKVPTGKKGTEAEAQSAAALVQGVQVTTLTIKDMEDVKKLPNLKDGYAAIMGQEQVSFANETKKALIFGVSGSYLNIDKSQIDYGRFFTESEDKSLMLLAVLGSKMKEKLFGDSDPIGEFIKIRKNKFLVIGVMKERGAVMQLNFDDFVYLPIRTLQKRIMGIDHVLYFVHQLDNLDLADETAEQARLILRENHNITPLPKSVETDKSIFGNIGVGMTDTSKDDFRVVTMAESMGVLDTVTGAITLLLLAIVAISLVVGGVGVMNIMYVVVTERTAEIGLRKAVGAKYADIMNQFLIEAVLITIIGGIIGVLVGLIVSFLVSLTANFYGLDWRFTIPIKAYLVALGFSTFFGLIFGIYPARKAAKLQPVDALRKE